MDGGRIASAALVEAAGALLADSEEKEDFLKALAWGKEDVACLFMLESAAVPMKEEGQEVLLSVDIEKQDDDDDDAAARKRASSSKDMHRTRALHGKRCLSCGCGTDRSLIGQWGREAEVEERSM